MIETPYVIGMHRLTARTYVYLQPPGTWGFSNCGLVAADGEAVLVDTQFTLPLTQRLLAAVRAAAPGARVTTVVTTHANGDHCWGNQLLPDAVTIGSAATAQGVADEISPEALAHLIFATPGGTALGAYLRRFFGHFDFAGIDLSPPEQTFTGEAQIAAGGTMMRLLEVGPAHTSGDVIVHVPDEGVLYAGDILFVDDHPVMWTGPVSNWIAACERICETGARYVVPGHDGSRGWTPIPRHRDRAAPRHVPHPRPQQQRRSPTHRSSAPSTNAATRSSPRLRRRAGPTHTTIRPGRLKLDRIKTTSSPKAL